MIELLLLPVCENKRPPYSNFTSSLQYDHIRLWNLKRIFSLATDIRLFYDFADLAAKCLFPLILGRLLWPNKCSRILPNPQKAHPSPESPIWRTDRPNRSRNASWAPSGVTEVGVILFFSWKTDFFSHRFQIFVIVTAAIIPSHQGVTPWMVSPKAVRTPYWRHCACLLKKEKRKKRNSEMWQVTYLPRPPTLCYPHQSCHVG